MSLGRLQHRIYLSLFAVAALSVAGAGIVSHVLPDRQFRSPYAERLLAEARFVARVVVAEGATDAVLADVANGLRLHAVVVDPEGRVVASTRPAPELFGAHFPRAGERPRWVRTSRGPSIGVALEDGRVVIVAARRHPHSALMMLSVFFLLLAAGCIPVARGLTRRLQSLDRGFVELGDGRLSTRVPVEGRDEIAGLARRFNASAERIERLVEAQRRVLRNASHELRSPLARIRMALELIRDTAGPEVGARVAEAIRDVGELDALVDDVLLASRIESEEQLAVAEDVDLAALAAEEAARFEARVEALPTTVVGDPRLLRRLLRNLLDNAVRHGGGREVVVTVAPEPDHGARVTIADRGPGVPPDDRERIFEPFYRGAPAREVPGVGLGLALVRQIAARHGGDVTCRSREGGGALFDVRLAARPPVPAR